ncbi:MAG: C10 family peptidase [Sedimentisphaerales bacterium]|nr:C10 family peptidase [Sedimentisphaerales bacterium]
MKAKNILPKVFCALAILGCTARALWAGPVTAYQAEKMVEGWLKTSPEPLDTALGRQVGKVETFRNDNGVTIYYIVYLEPVGFVIVPADDLIEPIVGFVRGTLYSPSLDNPLGALVTQDLNGRISAVRDTQWLEASGAITSAQQSQDKWDRLTELGEAGGPALLGLATITNVWVAPLVKSEWGQTTCCVAPPLACYNYYTPPFAAGSPGNYPCGCVATAMAQLMRYHEYPQAGIGMNSSTIWVDGNSQTGITLGGDGVGGPYDWNLMDYDPNCFTPGPNRAAIGALCYDAGVSVNMSYRAGSSRAFLTTADANLVNIFRYSNCIYAANPNSAPIWPGLTDMINPNLDYNHPVILSIMPEEDGHAVVCDGYGYNLTTLYHHLNMGWEGLQDAWYNFPGDMPPGYDYVGECLYNVFVTGASEIISGRITDSSGSPVAGVAVTAQRTGGGTYPAMTDSRGIYVLAHVPSASTYTVSPGPLFGTAVVNTGTSVDGASVSGNVWGVNFAYNTLYVDSIAMGLNDGSSWINAFNYLQDALAAATSGTQILVAEGVYKPDANTTLPEGSGIRSDTFQLKNGVGLYGGFPSGGCNDWADRHIASYETILSGDLAGNDAYVSDPCNLSTEPTRAENSYHVVTGSNTDATAILDGFTITAGNANGSGGWPDDEGGGMLNLNTNCTVNKCKLVENSAGAYSGGMRNGNSNLRITNCVFFRNAAMNGGGGMQNYDSSPNVVNCSFIWNKCVSSGSNGGGVYDVNSHPAVTNCSFIRNSAVYGGGMSNINGSCPAITNCTFTANLASTYSGAINDWNNAYPIINNCIFWDNNAPAGSQIGDSGSSAATVNYSDVQGGWTGAGGIGNINAGPCFVDANGLDNVIGTLDDDITLLPDSPCIDVGDNTAVPSGVTTDLNGRLRIADGDCNDSDIVDMGASEFAGVYIGDLDGDCYVDFYDFAIFAKYWLTSI